MNKDIAKEKIITYFQAWLTQDLELLLSVLDENVVIKECYGPVYIGKQAVERWFKEWHAGTNQVLTWEITSFCYDPDLFRAAVEWDFKCIFNGNEGAFYGSSIITFQAGQIISLNEYQMKQEQYYPYN